jgi:adenylate cyclase
MKTLIMNAISYIRQGVGLTPVVSTVNAMNEIISGYSPMLEQERTCELARKPVGILYADIADYTRLTEQDEEGTHRRLVKAVNIMRKNVAANNGRIAHLAGDAILAEFKDAGSAMQCAVNVQLVARQWNASLSVERQMLFRIGVNFGDVIPDRGDIYGNAVNLSARLEKLASSGGICVSETVRLKLVDHPSFKFVAMGKQYVKNINDPVQAFWILIDSQGVGYPASTAR